MSRSVTYTSSPLLASPTPVWRSRFVFAVIAMAFASLLGRSIYIQVIENDFFQKQGQIRLHRTITLPASRGRILDRNGEVLAVSIPVPSVWAVAEEVPRTPEALNLLAQLLGMGVTELKNKLGEDFVWLQMGIDESVGDALTALNLKGIILHRENKLGSKGEPLPGKIQFSVAAKPLEVSRKPQDLEKLARLLDLPLADLNKRLNERSFVLLKRKIDKQLVSLMSCHRLTGIYQVDEYQRQYPGGEAAAHVVGFTNVKDLGQEGIELALEKNLVGHDGFRQVVKNRQGDIVEDLDEVVEPVHGIDVQLSIDSKVQYHAYQHLKEAVLQHKAKAGSVVVLDVLTGEVLALANYPSYAPDQRQKLSGAQLRNRALIDIFEPGSTMKPFVVALALDRGKVTPESQIQTAGRYNIGSLNVTDAHPHSVLSVSEVIQKSSNVGTVKMSLQMPASELWQLYNDVGFGQKPDLPFPGIAKGIMHKHEKWGAVGQATMSYGYGISVSLFQLAHAYTIFARDGDRVPVSILKVNQAHTVGSPVISAKNAHAVRNMLNLVTGPGGTAPKAQTMGYSVGGKTGTAHKAEGRGYADKKYIGVFAGLAPIDQPRIVVAVMIDEPSNGKYFGGDVAAPVFSQTVQQTLKVLGLTPDRTVKPQIVTQPVAESL